MVAEWCQPRWSPTVRRASAADIGCGAIVVIPKYQPQRRLQIWIPSRGTCKNLTNKEPPPKFNVVFRPGKWVSALHRSLWGANDDIWGHSSLWKSGVNIIHRNYGYFTHYLHYHWCYMALSYFIIFFVNRSTSLLSQFSACCWPVAIHRSLLDLTRSRWLHQECSAHHGNLRPAGNAMRTTCAMIDLFRIAEISICLDIEKHICIYIYI